MYLSFFSFFLTGTYHVPVIFFAFKQIRIENRGEPKSAKNK